MDSGVFVVRRRNMVKSLRQMGITDENVLDAMNVVPRHMFVESSYEAFSYENQALKIACGQTISQPYTVALQSSLLQIKPNDKILEIGTGSGYQAAVLVQMGVDLFTIERQSGLYESTCKRLNSLGYSPKCIYGDGFEGLSTEAPFDGIIVTAGAEDVPLNLLKQLKVGGKIIIPIGEKKMNIYRIWRMSETEYKSEVIQECSFVPMLKGTV